MILNVSNTPTRCVRSFDKWTYLALRVVTTNLTFRYGHEQSEVTGDQGTSAQSDGLLVTQTATASQPFVIGWWKGDFWFSGSIAGTAVLINQGEFDDAYPTIPSSGK